ncbi:MAG TPA: DUF2652 domain-containing protein [Anaerolineales bacterium]|nr:DUF2652 domain-containing protein [Anaerolineales bacterium]
MSTVTQHGYLVIADISGYTSFVAKTELEHSHEILSELLGLLVEKFKPLMIISKLEGDAVFAYAAEEKITRGETLLEFLEGIYVAFRDRQISMRRATSCTCLACQNIPTLDLKFIGHHGDFIIQRVGDIRELVGSDVNLIHRLTKNHVSEETGWRAYLMLTEQCLDHLNLNLADTHTGTESYEHLGEVMTYSLDLHRRYDQFVSERRVFLTEDTADLSFTVDYPVPPHVAWSWYQSPEKRNIVMPNVRWSIGDRPLGRAGVGASNHCAHGGGMSTEVIVDWRPFEYSTTESYENGKKSLIETDRFEPLPDGGTRLHVMMKVIMPLPRFMRTMLARRAILNSMQYDKLLMQSAKMAGEEYSSAAGKD